MVTLPAIAAIRDQAGADRIWARLAREGSPLIDRPIAGPPDRCIATFCWRDTDASTGDGDADVFLDANGLTDRAWLADGLLRRVEGTDLWHLSLLVADDWRGGYAFLPSRAPLRYPGPGTDEHTWWRQVVGAGVPDPSSLAPSHDAALGGRRSEAAMPAAPPQRWWRPGPSTAGRTTTHRLVLAGTERRIHVHEAPVEGHGPRDLAVLFDGETWADRMPIAASLDALAAEILPRPLLAVLVDAVDPTTRARDLTCDPRFRDAIGDVLLPWIAARWPVTTDPGRRVMVGQSFGGLAATDLVLQRPDISGAAVVSSGSFWWPGASGRPTTAATWAWTDILDRAPARGARLWLEAGTVEPDMERIGRWFAADARAIGHVVSFRAYRGGHDMVQWRAGILDGIEALLRVDGPVRG